MRFVTNSRLKGKRMFSLLLSVVLFGQQPFSELVGPIQVQEVNIQDGYPVPIITWGGDVPLFYANGNAMQTKPGSIYKNLGLNIDFYRQDNFITQVKDYLEGKTPFLRGTLDMFAMASEVLGKDPRTKPVVIMQLTYSAGDHLVARKEIKNLQDLKGITIACQKGGPHVGLLAAILKSVNLKKEDVKVIWCDDLNGPNGPAEKFRQNPDIKACFVISPDMLGLTGGLESKGSNAEGNVEDSHVLVSTFHMSRAIADITAVRKDWFVKNKEIAEKYVAGYLKGCEKVVEMRRLFTESNKLTPEYQAVLEMAQSVFGKEAIPTLEVDGHGLLLDATFVGLPGQISFFEDEGNLSNFNRSMAAGLDFASNWGYVNQRLGFEQAHFDYAKVAQIAGIFYKTPEKNREIFTAEAVNAFPDEVTSDANTLWSFSINFEPNEKEFSADTYGSEFNRAMELASQYGKCRIVIRGHSDPTKTLVDFIKTGMNKGLITRTGVKGNYNYTFQGQQIDIKNTKNIVALIEDATQKRLFDDVSDSPHNTYQVALNLSQSRADAVKKSLTEFAKKQNVNLNTSQIVPIGVGISEPVIAKPTNEQEARQNMRVEFRLIKSNPESLKSDDFDY